MELKKNNFTSKEYGFTLIEILIAMVITVIVSAALFTAFQSQQNTYIIQENVVEMQQNLRAGMDMMVREIRMAGYDRQNIGGLGIVDVCPRDMGNNIDVTMSGNGAIKISADFKDDGVLNNSDIISFSIADSPISTPDGNPDLTRNNGGGRQLLAENIQALGFAYAFDADGDGILDKSSNGHIIWAIDSDGDNALDKNLDTNDDGNIDVSDGPVGNNGLISGTAISGVSVDAIRAVRIWMLARAERNDNKFLNTHTYVVGYKVITPSSDADTGNDNLRMRLLTTIVKCRNLGL